jgi:hypothetical protein
MEADQTLQMAATSVFEDRAQAAHGLLEPRAQDRPAT